MNRRHRRSGTGGAQRLALLRASPSAGADAPALAAATVLAVRANTARGLHQTDATRWPRVALAACRSASANCFDAYMLLRIGLGRPGLHELTGGAPWPLSSKPYTTRAMRQRATHARDLAAVLRRQLVDQRRDHAARAAPGRPEVDQHGLLALKHHLVESGVVNVPSCAARRPLGQLMQMYQL
jgi:hypothetical protein